MSVERAGVNGASLLLGVCAAEGMKNKKENIIETVTKKDYDRFVFYHECEVATLKREIKILKNNYIKIMNIKELNFCETFESKVKYRDTLEAVKDALTEKGKKELQEINKWIEDNIGNYLLYTGSGS